MAQDWITLAGDDLWKIISRPVLEKADEDAEGGTVEDNNFNDALATRATEAVRMAVTMIRAAIYNGRRTTVSLTADSIPPEAERYALAIAAYDLTSSPPSLQQVLVFEGGIYSPRQKLYQEAMDWMKQVREGKAVVTPPTDPDTDNVANPIRWGDYTGTSTEETAGKYDLTTDGPWVET